MNFDGIRCAVIFGKTTAIAQSCIGDRIYKRTFSVLSDCHNIAPSPHLSLSSVLTFKTLRGAKSLE